MELTNEEKKKLFDAALELAKALATLHMATERLSMMSKLSERALAISLDEETMGLATMPFREAYGKAVDGFLSAMGVGGMNDPFRKFLNERMEAERKAKEAEEAEKAKALEKGKDAPQDGEKS